MSESVIIRYKGLPIDVTQWQSYHPGGSKVLRVMNGRDATDCVITMHTDEALRKIEHMAHSQNPESVSADGQCLAAFTRETQALLELRHELRLEGYFRPRWWVEAWTFLYTNALLYGGLCLIAQHSALIGSFILGFGWYQFGWLGHDYSHHTVLHKSQTAATQWNDWIGWYVGAVRGTTLLWWKLRHNTHHIVTNEEGSDPDIKLKPLLYFFDRFQVRGPKKWQAQYYLGVIGFLHLFWMYESFRVTARHFKAANLWTRRLAHWDLLALMLHLLMVVSVGWVSQEWLALGVAYFMSGALTALTVFASHYSENRITAEEARRMGLGLLRQTAAGSRNVCGFFGWDNWVIFVLTGGISHQIEHHLFPTMPRLHLYWITPRVRRVFAELGLQYREDNLYTVTRMCVRQLSYNTERSLVDSGEPQKISPD